MLIARISPATDVAASKIMMNRLEPALALGVNARKANRCAANTASVLTPAQIPRPQPHRPSYKSHFAAPLLRPYLKHSRNG